MKSLTGTGLMLLIFICSFSQREFSPGWILKTNGDTLRGYLQEEIRKDIYETIKFKSNSGSSDFSLFAVDEVKSFKYDEGNLYQAISFTNSAADSSVDQSCFARQLVKGNYDLFDILKEEKFYYVIKDENMEYFLFNSVFNTNGELEKLGNYVNCLTQLAATCNAANLHPERVDYTGNEMTKFILELNHCISPEKQAVSFYQKTKTQVQLLLYAGGLPLGNRSELAAQAVLKFVNPQINPKLSFNIGFHYSSTVKPVLNYFNQYTHTDYIISSVPLFIQYNFTNGIVQPFIYAGGSAAFLIVNPDNPYDPYDGNEIFGNHGINLELLGGVGIEVYLTHWLMARIEWRYEYTFQYPTVGLALKF